VDHFDQDQGRGAYWNTSFFLWRLFRIGARGTDMKVKLELTRAGRRLHQSTYEIEDAQSFGAAWEDVWAQVRETCMARATSIGALMDTMHESVIDELDGATMTLTRL
jgi:hypothetical protein